MPEDIRISMFEIVGGSLCVASSDGQKIYDRLAAALKADRHVIISFHKRHDADRGFPECRDWSIVWNIQ